MSITWVVVLTLSGCGLLGDADNSGTGGLTAVKISVMPTIDLAPFHLARRNGYFKAEGLEITSSVAPSGPAAAGVGHQGIQWVTIPFPDIPARLQRGDVDAAFLTEPFITQAIQTVGAVPVFDTATGPTAGLPTAGYGATAAYVSSHGSVIDAFKRAMARATAEALADRTRIEPLLVEYAKVTPEIAKSAKLLTFESAVDAASIQRVPDLMLRFGMIPARVDVTSMI